MCINNRIQSNVTYSQDETDSIAETESDRAEVKGGREEGEREAGAINLSSLASRSPSQPTANINDIDNEVSQLSQSPPSSSTFFFILSYFYFLTDFCLFSFCWKICVIRV